MAVPEIWSDLHQKIIHDSRGGVKRVVNVDSVIGSIDNILGTRPGERVMLPEFASPLKDMVFERIDQDLLDWIGREVREVIERWDDRVKVVGIDFFTDPDRSYVQMSISFRIRGYDRVFEHHQKMGGS